MNCSHYSDSRHESCDDVVQPLSLYRTIREWRDMYKMPSYLPYPIELVPRKPPENDNGVIFVQVNFTRVQDRQKKVLENDE